MTSDPEEAAHLVGQTSGSPQRPGHRLARPVLDFDLESEVAQLRAEESWRHGTRNAKTLVKEPDFRIVLVTLKRGARIEAHQAPGRLSIQTLMGQLRVGVGGQTIDLPACRVLALDPNVAHDVEAGADDDSAFLLTIAWPAGGSEAPTEGGATV